MVQPILMVVETGYSRVVGDARHILRDAAAQADLTITEASPAPNQTSITREPTGATAGTSADRPFLLAGCMYVA